MCVDLLRMIFDVLHQRVHKWKPRLARAGDASRGTASVRSVCSHPYPRDKGKLMKIVTEANDVLITAARSTGAPRDNYTTPLHIMMDFAEEFKSDNPGW